MEQIPDVLVAGAGPVGLTAALELTRRGVRVRVVDRADGPAVTSRATAIHARTLEIYEQMGLSDEILGRGQRVDGFTMHRNGRAMIRFGSGYDHLPTRYPFTLQIDQVLTEEVLRTALAGRGVEVEWGVELTGLDQDEHQVTGRLRHASGREERCVVPWLIGADGGHSTVRRALGLNLSGESTETWLIADAVIDADLPRDSLHWIHGGDGTVLMVPFPTPGKWRLVDTADVAQSDDPRLVAERFQGKIARALGREVRVERPTWVSVFTIQQRMIDRMREGRCFVAGDAAHVHSPASGQGMNTGVQDAYNLAWKLADVVRGHASEELLDSYQHERTPVGEVLMRTTRTATALIALRNAVAPIALPLGLGFLDLVKPLKRRVERKIMTTMSGLALDYSASPLSLPSGNGDGLLPGHRVAWSARQAAAHPGWQAIAAELTDPRWTLLADAGQGTGAAAVAAALDDVIDGHGAAVSVRTLSAAPVGSCGARPLTDPGRAVRTAVGIPEGGFALIRPDGHLAAKGSVTADLDGVLREVGLRQAEAVPAEEV
ncbi:FAD-dependent oxidoreductase [Amycolatopsis speibonae]|uniref:FAD-dependent oxidoreductase n=1 Tax=Amycolatopsis speibonae TaxID=1450224 RepID=A0ABV7NPF9_9PSEU